MAKRNVKLVEEIKLNHFKTQSFFLFFSFFKKKNVKFQNLNQNIPSVNCSVYHPALPREGQKEVEV